MKRLAPLAVVLLTLCLATSASAARQDAVQRALSHVHDHPNAAHDDAAQGYGVRDVILDSDGTEHVRLTRTYRGLRVLGGDLVVHSTTGGAFRGISQTVRDRVAVGTRPAVSREGAITIARTQFRSVPETTDAELIVDAVDAPALAWDVVLTGTLADDSPSELHVIVDAQDGGVRRSFDDVQHVLGTGRSLYSGAVPLEAAFAKRSYSLKDAGRGGQWTCDLKNRTSNCTVFTDADNTWGNGTTGDRASAAADAHFGAAQTWDFFKSLGRTGIDGLGTGAASRVHYSSNYNNAFWNTSCYCMTYGDGDGVKYGPLTALDVAGHEMSHGVTEKTAGLVYSGESGGLNEATSDIFGTMVEFQANVAADPPDYKIGEQFAKSKPALRYMYEPSLDGASADCYSDTVGSLDVHYSSGVANHFFYLLAEGTVGSKACNGATLTGIGRAASTRIWYDALTKYMVSSTNYAGARAATLQAAAGEAERLAIAAAWDAVKVQ